jgi:hypothetical protein
MGPYFYPQVLIALSLSNQLNPMNISNLAEKLFNSKITEDEVKEIVEYAYHTNAMFNWHPLGFVHYKLFENDGTILRLHIWPSTGRRYQEPQFTIHDHIFDMTSYIVTGVQTNVLYKVYSDSEKPNGKLYSVGYVEGQSWVRDIGRQISFIELSRTEYKKNETYSMTEAIFHESDIRNDALVCTVVTTKNKLSRTPIVIGPIEGEKEYRYVRENCSLEVSKELLQKVLREI